MIKSITNFLIIFFIFQQLKSQISQIDQNGYNAFCDETLHIKHDELITLSFKREHFQQAPSVISLIPPLYDYLVYFEFVSFNFFFFMLSVEMNK